MRTRIVTELSCYLDNQPGILARLTERIAEQQVSVKGIQNYEGKLQSLVMLVVDKVDVAEEILRSMGVDLISRTDILEVDVPNRVGGLAEITKIFGGHSININTIYASDSHYVTSVAYIKVDDVEMAERILNSAPLKEEEAFIEGEKAVFGEKI